MALKPLSKRFSFPFQFPNLVNHCDFRLESLILSKFLKKNWRMSWIELENSSIAVSEFLVKLQADFMLTSTYYESSSVKRNGLCFSG